MARHDNDGVTNSRDDVTITPHAETERSSEVRQYDFLINDDALCGDDLFLVVIVVSALAHTEARQAIRDTWGEATDDTQVVFLIGLPDPDVGYCDQLQDMIQHESSLHHDIIQADIIDNYKNLTLKSIAMLQWLQDFCSSVKYVLKTDDDMFINVPLLVLDLQHTVHRRFVMGHLIAGAHPIRDPQSKWYTPEYLYPDIMYPKYMSGTAYVISGDLIPELVDVTYFRPTFWLEDIYITGICMDEVGGQHIYNGKFGFIMRDGMPCVLRKVITAHNLIPEELYEIWEVMGNKGYECADGNTNQPKNDVWYNTA